MSGAPIVKLDAGSLGTISGSTASLASKLGEPIGSVGGVISSLDWKVKADANIEGRLNEIKASLQRQESSLNSMKAVVDSGCGKIDNSTGRLNTKTNAIAMNAASNVQANPVQINWHANNLNSMILASIFGGIGGIFAQIFTTITSPFTNFFSSFFGGSSSTNSYPSGDHGNIVSQYQDEHGVTWAVYEDGTKEALYATHDPTLFHPEPDGPTKPYTYNGSEYNIVQGYDPSMALYQKDYALPVAHGGPRTNSGCMACCVCMAYNITHGTNYQLTGKDGKGANGAEVPSDQDFRHLNGKTVYEDNGYMNSKPGTEPKILVGASNEAKYSKIAELTGQGKPVILEVGNNGHYVLAIGIKAGADPNNLTADDILVVDPSKDSKTAMTLSDSNYSLSSTGGMWACS